MGRIRQKNIPWLGGFIESLYNSLPILSIINFLSIITVFYISLREYLLPWFPWITFRLFIIFMVVLVFLLILLMYKFVIPSLWVFRGKQLYGFESELMQEIKKLGEEVKELKEGSGK